MGYIRAYLWIQKECFVQKIDIFLAKTLFYAYFGHFLPKIWQI